MSGIDPLTEETSFNIQAFFDTGASGVLLSKETADALGVAYTPGVTFEDVGIGGSSSFNVSVPLLADLAPFAPLVNINESMTPTPTTSASVRCARRSILTTQICSRSMCSACPRCKTKSW